MKKLLTFLFLIPLAVVLSGCTTEQPVDETINSFEDCANAGYTVMESYPRQCRTPDGRLFVEEINEEPIGGERDEHGCLGSAGYSWDEEIPACIRTWELENENQREAAKIAVAPLSYYVTVVGVDVLRCPGCFIVHLQRNDGSYQKITVILSDWKVTDTSVSITPEECTDLGGRLVNTVGGDTCNEDEEKIADVHGFISPNICCVDSSKEEFCGTSTQGPCKFDSDCTTGGCSGEVCQSKDEEPIMTACVFRDCYNSVGYSCSCVNNKCVWT